ncbi:MAG TPA: FGGY family carbohydrate kinase [Ideonella sp.]|uniref:FGGY family carbohydrate kinase n=1 Tax=Ideonella sp. TaxID=1929293 RepID=UPI002E37F97C|nr:FGGY family carbohydrate kinase [Ideonella sp.]HEX5685900.1 FGGY family carbohydrate kinase [Ideonella sp.]
MRTDIYLGIDMGSTGLKAVAFEAGSGAALASSGVALPFRSLPHGGCELDAPAIHAALFNALRGVAGQLGPRLREVRAIGCTGHGAGLYALGTDGQLVGGHAVASTDQRACLRARALAVRDGAALLAEVGCCPWPGQPTLIAAEMFTAQPWRRQATSRLLFAKDYLAYLLTGAIATDASDASTAGLLSLATGTWSSAAFEAVGLDAGAFELPPIVPSGTAIGTLTRAAAQECGLPAGLPVAIGAIDLLASLKAVGADERGQAVAVFGTWCVNAVVGPVIEPLPTVGAVVHFGSAEQRLYLENTPSSMANIAWLARTLQFASAAAVVDCAMSMPLGAAGLRFLPFINGGSAPPHAMAGFVGLRAHHDRAHMARAVVDAVAALHARHLGHLTSQGLGMPHQVAALGGGARDERLVRLLASFLGHPVERCGDDETGARGAALYAALSQGAGGVIPASRSLVEPDTAASQAYADYLTGFDAMIDHIAPVFAQLAGAGR